VTLSTLRQRQLRVIVLSALDQRVAQFRRREEIWPFRVPHEPLDFDAFIDDALAGEAGRIDAEDLRSRYVLSLRWPGGEEWSAWAVALPSGLHVYCDTNSGEHRVLASAKRGSALEADRFFLELLAESRGHHFGIEMSGPLPSRVQTPIDDRDLLADVFVDLFEGTPAAAELRAPAPSADFKQDVVAWLTRVLVAPPPRRASRRMRRFREDPEGGYR
jgi:hypothetical protein